MIIKNEDNTYRVELVITKEEYVELLKRALTLPYPTNINENDIVDEYIDRLIKDKRIELYDVNEESLVDVESLADMKTRLAVSIINKMNNYNAQGVILDVEKIVNGCIINKRKQ